MVKNPEKVVFSADINIGKILILMVENPEKVFSGWGMWRPGDVRAYPYF
ncbi:MAG: hypothetical protein SWH68_09685 [Thermodesulfobacteriota bacterium]|nr:hypothetical protein [Thermodesulfobacteriota bacterium]